MQTNPEPKTATSSAEQAKSLDSGNRFSVARLSAVFWTWKTLILLIAITSPGPGYDTSTTLLDFGIAENSIFTPLSKLIQSLVRWDAIYFTSMAQRGHLYEQEWAFGIGISSTLSWLARHVFHCSHPRLWQIALSGIVLSHISHYLAVLLVWRISKMLVGTNTHKERISFITALLYALSPAGVFLSAPYTESLFALCNLLGIYLYMLGLVGSKTSEDTFRSILFLPAGVAFAVATVIRSNGILSGALFGLDAIHTLYDVLKHGANLRLVVKLFALISGGAILATGMIIPQYIAYREFCSSIIAQERRSWCQQTIPSIFTFTQSHYWNVGPFRYWTVSNLPLFLLASPVLYLMITNSYRTIASLLQNSCRNGRETFACNLAFHLAVPELLLSLLALTSYHVQIITRISSGYVLWYFGLARSISEAPKAQASEYGVRLIILYALIQAALFSAFLPPA